MKLSIVIVSYNSCHFLKNCIPSIESSSLSKDTEVIVVDNASKDDTVGFLRANFPSVKIITNKANLGFGQANNIGAAAAKGEYLLFLNPDTVLNTGSLKDLVEFIDGHPAAGAVGPKLLYPDGSLQFSCRKDYTVRVILILRTFMKYFMSERAARENLMIDWDHASVKKVDWLLAACLIIRNDVFSKIGGYDTRYKLYFEDVDLCKRLIKAGYVNFYCPKSVVTHYHQRDSANGFSKKTVWHIQSAIKYFNKHGWRF